MALKWRSGESKTDKIQCKSVSFLEFIEIFLRVCKQTMHFRKVTSSATRIYLFARVQMGQTGDVSHFQNGRSLYNGSTEHYMWVLNWHKITDMTLCDPIILNIYLVKCCVAEKNLQKSTSASANLRKIALRWRLGQSKTDEIPCKSDTLFKIYWNFLESL